MGAVSDLLKDAGSRRLLLTLGAVAVGVVVAVAVSTPWSPLTVPPDLVVPPEPTRDFSAAEIAAADAFHADVRPPALLSLGTGLVATALVGLTPVGAALVRRLPSPAWAPVLVPAVTGGVLVLAAVRLVTLPLASWQESMRRDAGLSTRDWTAWAVDVGKGFALSTTLTVAGVVAVVLLARRSPQRWWATAAPGAAGLVVVASLAYPLVVEPVFNRFEPLPDGPLRASLLRLAESEGVTVGDVLVADASRRTTTLNAYVSGLGPTRRVVLYDTLLDSAPDDEIRVVVAHELAHARENDVLAGTLVGAGGAALLVLLLAAVAARTPLPRAAGLGTPGPDRSPLGQAAAVPFVLAVATVLGVIAGPVEAAVSRQVEARADVVALDLTRDPATFTRMQRTLALTALSDVDPPPLLYLWFASHPTAPGRIALARTWAAANDEPTPPDLAAPAVRGD
jgi:STE24 endopeptidase